jgi:acetolactate synthase-1/2/3 large subunit
MTPHTLTGARDVGANCGSAAGQACPRPYGIVGGAAPLLHAMSKSDIALSACATRPRADDGRGRLHEHRPVAWPRRDGAGPELASGAACFEQPAVLLITTNQHRAAAYPHSGMFMDLDTRAVLAPLTKWNTVVHDPRRIPELARRAFREALGGRPGPVHLDIPQDVLGAVAASPTTSSTSPRPVTHTGRARGRRAMAQARGCGCAPPADRGRRRRGGQRCVAQTACANSLQRLNAPSAAHPDGARRVPSDSALHRPRRA